MNRVFISSPYSGAVERNVEYARRCMRHSFDHGEAPLATHLLYTQPTVLDDTIPIERERGTQAAFEWITASEIVAFYVDLGWTPGMIKELKIARLFTRAIEIRSLFPPHPLTEQPQEVQNLLKESRL